PNAVALALTPPVLTAISKNSRLVHCDSAMVPPASAASGHAVDNRACADTVAFPVPFLTPLYSSRSSQRRSSPPLVRCSVGSRARSVPDGIEDQKALRYRGNQEGYRRFCYGSGGTVMKKA